MPTQVINYPRSESLELLRQYQQSPCKDVRNRIVQLNIG